MPQLTVLSWNLRTFGINQKDTNTINIADIINREKPDMIFIQEFQTGEVPKGVGVEANAAQITHIENLLHFLESQTGFNTIDMGITGTNSSKSGESGGGEGRSRMRDAYAGFFLVSPSITYGRDRFDIIHLIDLKIVNPAETDKNLKWPGRRPGLFEFKLVKGREEILLNVLSLHAPTGEQAKQALRKLPQLKEVGGGRINRKGKPVHIPMPNIPCIVLGDFNVNSNDDSYQGLLNNYDMGIGTPQNPVATTYSTKASNPPKRVSSFDNVIYPKQPGFKRRRKAEAIDFAEEEIRTAKRKGIDESEAYRRIVKTQNFVSNGLSDHLPVIITFEIN